MKKAKWFALALLLAAPVSGAATEVPLPAFEVVDALGAPVSSDALKQAQPWCLLVVAAGDRDTKSGLSRLQREAGWGGRLVVVVVGDEAGFAALIEAQEKMTGAQWYRDGSGSIIKALKLGGLPALLGIVPGDAIAWRSSAIPADAAEAQSLVSTWLDHD